MTQETSPGKSLSQLTVEGAAAALELDPDTLQPTAARVARVEAAKAPIAETVVTQPVAVGGELALQQTVDVLLPELVHA